ncbi:2OG-Fe(II) oxygenase [Lysobacter sp. A3-1-A15]|uniref:2OG-Fe(II) oxygenase n=1 Tax=Novilysobacter viscosus TaxID=3098602 RepID=UPI002ED98417
MINNTLDVGHWRERLGRDGRVQVEDFLQAEAARHLHDCLARDVPWTLAIRDRDGARTIAHEQYRAMPGEQVRRLLAAAADTGKAGADAEAGFSFAYDSYMMVRAYQEGRDPDLLLHRVLELFNSPGYLGLVQALSGDRSIRRVNAQATCYRPGHFLRYHTDVDSREGRRFAYVLNLSRGWQADWGGLLQFIDEAGQVTGTFMPRWNSLSVFAVPAGHAVSMVAPWAGTDRLAITGWWLAR